MNDEGATSSPRRTPADNSNCRGRGGRIRRPTNQSINVSQKERFLFPCRSAGTWLSFQRLVSFRTRISHPSVCFFYSFLLLSIISSPCVQCVGRPNRFQHKINGRGSRFNHPFPMHDRARRGGSASPRCADLPTSPVSGWPAASGLR